MSFFGHPQLACCFQSLSAKTSGEFDQQQTAFLAAVLAGSPGQITSLEILIPLV